MERYAPSSVAPPAEPHVESVAMSGPGVPAGSVTCHSPVGLRRVSAAVTAPLPHVSCTGVAGAAQPVESQPRPSGRSPVAAEMAAVRTLIEAPGLDAARFSKRTIDVVFEYPLEVPGAERLWPDAGEYQGP